LRGWVVARGHGIKGATVQVQAHPSQTRTLADGSWFYYFGLDQSTPDNVNVTAVLPDGRTLTQNQTIKPRATVIVPRFEFP
jgi:hypothetical protein